MEIIRDREALLTGHFELAGIGAHTNVFLRFIMIAVDPNIAMKMAEKVAAHLDREKIDGVMASFDHAGEFGLYLSWALNVPLVLVEFRRRGPKPEFEEGFKIAAEAKILVVEDTAIDFSPLENMMSLVEKNKGVVAGAVMFAISWRAKERAERLWRKFDGVVEPLLELDANYYEPRNCLLC